MKRHFDLWFMDIDFRDFYQVKDNSEFSDKLGWSDYWLCWNKNCWCWEYKELQQYKDIRKVSLWKKTNFYNRTPISIAFWFTIGLLIGILI